MREKPILFSTPMVQAALNGTKTQTRRVVLRKGYNESIHHAKNDYAHNDIDNLWQFGYRAENRGWPQNSVGVFSRYQPGDVLWVRETWMPCATIDSLMSDADIYTYKADWTDISLEMQKNGVMGKDAKWRPSIHMPCEAARLFLRVTGVRAERVQDITPADCLAEGIINEICERCLDFGSGCYPRKGVDVFCENKDFVVEQYAALWDSLNAKRGYGWDVNPWVWVYTFERIKGEGSR